MPFDANIAKEIDAVLAKYTRDPYDSTGHGVPRVVVLAADKSGIIYRGRAGYEQLPEHPASEQQLADAPTIQEESIFELFSCTKLVATIAALQLIEQGKMNLDSPASDFVPELKDVQVLKGFGDDGQPKLERTDAVVTIEQLLTHTAGSVYPFKHERAEDAMRMTEHLGFGDVGPNHADAKREHLTKLPMMFTPGSHWAYGFNMDWLALAVAQASGLGFGEYLEKNIFAPLGITDMGYEPNPKKISMAYHIDGQPHKFGPGAVRKGAELGGSGLQGSPISYLKIVQALLNGGELDGARILKPETVADMFKSHLSKDPEVKKVQIADLQEFATDSDPFSHARGSQVPGSIDWGLGGILTNVDGNGYTHGRGSSTLAWSGMANTFWTVDKEKELVTCSFFNTLPYADPGAMACWKETETLLYKGAGKA